MELIRDLLWLWILGALAGSAYLAWELWWKPRGGTVPTPRPLPGTGQVRSTAGARAASPPPDAREPATAALPPRTASGPLPARSPNPSEAALEARIPASALPDSAIKAARMEERGFHVPPQRRETPAAPVPEPAAATPAPAAAAGPLPAAPAATAAAPVAPPASPPPAQPGVVRSQTAELDDILKRIDAVLSESGGQAVATMASEQGLNPPAAPPTETLPRRGEPGRGGSGAAG